MLPSLNKVFVVVVVVVVVVVETGKEMDVTHPSFGKVFKFVLHHRLLHKLSLVFTAP